MKCASGSPLSLFALTVGLTALGFVGSARGQEPAAPGSPTAIAQATPTSEAPPAASEPQPAAPAAPPAAAAASSVKPAENTDKPAADDNGDDDENDNGNGNASTDGTRRDDVIGVSTQSQGFDGDPWGDDGSQMAAGPLTFRLALQTRYRETFPVASGNMEEAFVVREDVLAQDGDGFRLQRFLMRMAVTPALTPWLSFKGTLDFAKLRGSNVSNVVKQALATLRPWEKRIEIYVGVFKIAYSILELDPVSRYELTDLGDANELINNMGFAGRDVGVAVMFAPLPKPKWARIVLGTFRGRAEHEQSSPFGVMAARIESKPFGKALRFGASMVGMPSAVSYKQPFETSSRDVLPQAPNSRYPRELRWDSGKAYGVDISYSRKRFSIRVEGLLGDRVDVDQRYNARSYSAVWGLVAYRFKIGPIGLMPAARVEFMDADREHDTGGRRIVSFGLNVLYKRSVRFVFDVSHTDVQDNTSVIEQPRPLPYTPYIALDNTRVTGQLQLEL
jgi:hypothetical protein